MDFNAYVDEAGDEGFKFAKGSSRWFILAGIVVPRVDDLKASHVIDDVKAMLGTRDLLKPLHWRSLKHRQKLAWIKKVAATSSMKLIVVALDKTRLKEDTPLAIHPRMYLYLCRYLLERISWFVRDAARDQNSVNIFFANRSSISYTNLEKYIESVCISEESRIASDVLGRIVPQQIHQKKLLQVADAVASSAYEALNPDQYGNTDPNYFINLIPLLYRRNDNLLSYGLKLLPGAGVDHDVYRKQYPWIVEYY